MQNYLHEAWQLYLLSLPNTLIAIILALSLPKYSNCNYIQTIFITSVMQDIVGRAWASDYA